MKTIKNDNDDDEELVLEKKKIKIEDIMTPPERFKKRTCKNYNEDLNS